MALQDPAKHAGQYRLSEGRNASQGRTWATLVTAVRMPGFATCSTIVLYGGCVYLTTALASVALLAGTSAARTGKLSWHVLKQQLLHRSSTGVMRNHGGWLRREWFDCSAVSIASAVRSRSHDQVVLAKFAAQCPHSSSAVCACCCG